MHLEQTMQPGFAPPPPFKRFFRKAMLSKAAQMLVQLQVSPAAVPSCSAPATNQALETATGAELHCTAVL